MISTSIPTTPVGVRDLTPELAAEFYALEACLIGCFDTAGYRRVLTPAFELAHVLERGMGPKEAARLLRFVDPQNGEVLALRSDITPQIARLVAGPMSASELPLRLSYFGRVFRLRRHYEFQRREVAQAGVELIGPNDAAADAEVIGLCSASLDAAGATNHTLSIGHNGILTALLKQLEISEQSTDQLKSLLLRKDSVGVSEFGDQHRLASGDTKILESLCGLYGKPHDVLQRVESTLQKTPFLKASVSRLKAVLGQLGDVCDKCVVDLGEMQGFGYYTGIVFHAYVPGVGQAVASGGRYDELLGRYGRDVPAAGFAIDEEGLSCRQ